MDEFNACILGKFPSYEKKLAKMCNKTINNATKAKIMACQDIMKKEVMAALLLHGSDKFQ